MPVTRGASFTVSTDFMKPFATNFVAAGGDPADSARFFFGDLAVKSLDALAEDNIPTPQTRLLLGNLAASGVLRRNLVARQPEHQPPHDHSGDRDTHPGALADRALAVSDRDPVVRRGIGGPDRCGGQAPDWVVSTVAHVSVPVLLALYGYNRGYLQVVLEHPPAGVPSMQDTLTCDSFLACNSTAFPLELATRYDDALSTLSDPTSPGWAEMSMWTTVLEGATGAGRFVWEGLARAGFSPHVLHGAGATEFGLSHGE